MKNKFLRLITTLLLMVAVLLPTVPMQAVQASGWTYKQKLSFNMLSVNSTFKDFPVLISLNATNFDFTLAKTNGEDIRFIDSDNITALPYLITSWNATSQEASLVVRVPEITENTNYTDCIYMLFGNSLATDGQSDINEVAVTDNTSLVNYQPFYATKYSPSWRSPDWYGFRAINVGIPNGANFTVPGFSFNRTELDYVYTNLAAWTDLSPEAVYEAGGLGSVLKIGSIYYLYYDTYYNSPSISYAISSDGVNWTYAGVALTTGGAGTWDVAHVGIPYVFMDSDNTTYYMLYRGCSPLPTSDRKIGIASSLDGINWTKSVNNPINIGDDAWADGGVESWGVIKVNQTYYTYYSSFNGLIRRIGVATTNSTPNNWSVATLTKYVGNPIFGDFYRCMDVFAYGGKYYALPMYRAGVGDSQIQLWVASNPLFTDKTFVKIVKQASIQNDWNKHFVDTPYVMTDNISRNSFPGNKLKMYYAGVETDPIYKLGLVTENDIDVAVAANVSSLDMLSGFTVATRLLPQNNTAGEDTIVGKTNQTSGGGGWSIGQSNTNKIVVYLYDGVAPSPAFTTTANIPLTSPTNLVATWNGSTNAGSIKVYFNGVLQAGTEANYGTIPSVNNSNYYRIGNVNTPATSRGYGGQIYEVATHNKGVSSSDVARINEELTFRYAVNSISFGVINTTPFFTTQSANNITMNKNGITGTTINGTLTSTGGLIPCSVYFNYGITSAYGTNTTANIKNASDNFSSVLPNNLIPGQTYHYRASGNNTLGYGEGNDVTFTLTMPTVTTGAATDSTLIAGEVTNAGVATDCYVYFNYGDSPSFGNSTPPTVITGTGTFSATIPASVQTVYYQAVVQVGAVTSTGSTRTIDSALTGVDSFTRALPILIFSLFILSSLFFIWSGFNTMKSDGILTGLLMVSIGIIIMLVGLIAFDMIVEAIGIIRV